MENLTKNVLITLAVEVIAMIILNNINLDVFAPFVILLAFAVNISFVYYLFRFRPKWYLLLVALLLIPIIMPIVIFIAALSTMQC